MSKITINKEFVSDRFIIRADMGVGYSNYIKLLDTIGGTRDIASMTNDEINELHELLGKVIEDMGLEQV